jgi:hypothetical protein
MAPRLGAVLPGEIVLQNRGYFIAIGNNWYRVRRMGLTDRLIARHHCLSVT